MLALYTMPPFKNPQEQRFNAKRRDTIQNSEPHSDMQTREQTSQAFVPTEWSDTVEGHVPCRPPVAKPRQSRRPVSPCSWRHPLFAADAQTDATVDGSRRDFHLYLPGVFSFFDSTLSSYIKDSLQIIVTVHLRHPLKGSNYILIRHLWAGLSENPAVGDEWKFPPAFIILNNFLSRP